MAREQDIQAAIRFHDENPDTTVQSAAIKFSVPKSTLHDRINARSSNRRKAHTRQQLLTPDREAYLIKYLKLWCTSMGALPRITDVEDFVARRFKVNVGKHWVKKFITRHGNIILYGDIPFKDMTSKNIYMVRMFTCFKNLLYDFVQLDSTVIYAVYNGSYWAYIVELSSGLILNYHNFSNEDTFWKWCDERKVITEGFHAVREHVLGVPRGAAMIGNVTDMAKVQAIFLKNDLFPPKKVIGEKQDGNLLQYIAHHEEALYDALDQEHRTILMKIFEKVKETLSSENSIQQSIDH